MLGTRCAKRTARPTCWFRTNERISDMPSLRESNVCVHHDRDHYIHCTCTDRKCRHSVFVPKPTAISAPSMSKLFGKTDFKRMRYPFHVILMALSMFYLGKNSSHNIALILRTVMNLQISHTTISNWCTKFAPIFQNIAIQLIPALNFNSDE